MRFSISSIFGLGKNENGKARTKLLAGIAVVLMLVGAIAGVMQALDGPATVTTSKKRYDVGETMHISGTGFAPSVSIAISVETPDHTTELVPPGTVSDSTGAFADVLYTPSNPRPGRYRITATDNLGGEAHSAVTEADAIGYNKGIWVKDAFVPNDNPAGHWTTGNAGSFYLEGDWVFYQYQTTGIGNTVPNFVIYFDHQSNGAIFIDALNNFRACVDTLCESVDTTGGDAGMLLDGVPHPPLSTAGGWINAVGAVSNIANAYTGNDTCSGVDPLETPSQFHCISVNGALLKAALIASPAVPDNIFDSGTHSVNFFVEAHLAETSVWTNGKEYLLGCSSQPQYYAAPGPWAVAGGPYGTNIYNPTVGPCGFNAASSWDTTAFTAAGNVSGSSGHFNLDPTEGNSGAITLPIPTATAPTGSITIVKATVPANSNTNFDFTGLANFTLNDSGVDCQANAPTPPCQSITFSQLAGGDAFSFNESASLPSGWSLNNNGITCVNNAGTSTWSFPGDPGVFPLSGSSRSVSIVLAFTDSAHVTCTFTNTFSKATPPISTEMHRGTSVGEGAPVVLAEGGSVPLGTIMHDSATVSTMGSFPAPSGTVTFRFYTSAASCTTDSGLVAAAGTALGSAVLGANVAHPSSDTAALGAGTYAFRARYPGDSNYNAVVSACENFTVNKAQLDVTTIPHNAAHASILNAVNVLSGSIVHDTATVTGGVAGFTVPTPTFTLTSSYTGTCAAGAVVANNGTEGAAAKSADSAALTAGAYAYRAEVAGDANYLGDTGDCEPFTVTKLNSTTVTAIHNATHGTVLAVAVASTVHDQATVTGSGPTPTGTVIFDWFLNGACSGAPAASSTPQALTGGVVDATGFSFTVNTAGARAFRATYAGDTVYNGSTGDCEPLAVVDANIQITPGTGVNPVGDTHTITGHVNVNPGTGFVNASAGTIITFTITSGPGTLTPPTPTTCATIAATGSCTVTLTSAVVGTTVISASTTVTVNTVSLTRTTDGIGANSGTASKTWVDSSVTTQVHNPSHVDITNASVARGTVVHDSATVDVGAGLIVPAGSTFTFHRYTTINCTGTATDQTGVAITPGAQTGTSESSTFATPATAGQFSYKADFVSGDVALAANKTGVCEPFTTVDANIQLTPGTGVNPIGDTHTLTGHVNVNPGTGFVNAPAGTIITFAITAGPGTLTPPTPTTCATIAATGSCTVTLTSAVIGTTTINASTTVSVNSVSLTRSTGDANAGDGPNATKTWVASTVTTQVHNATHGNITNNNTVPLGTVVHDNATVDVGAGLVVPAGSTFTFHRFTTLTCTGASTDQAGVAVPAGAQTGSADSSTFTPDAGTYGYLVDFISGDTAAAASKTGVAATDCEPFTIVKVNTTTVTQIHSGTNHADVGSGPLPAPATVHDSATVSAKVDGKVIGGTVSFRFYGVNAGAPAPFATAALAAAACNGDTDFAGADGLAVGGAVALVEQGNGDGLAHPSANVGPLGSGFYAFKAKYSGDVNYNASTGACEPLEVQAAMPLVKLIDGLAPTCARLVPTNPDFSNANLVGGAAGHCIDQYGTDVTGLFAMTLSGLPSPFPPSLTVNIPPLFEAPGLNGVTFGLCEAVPAGWQLLSISFSINGGAPVSQPLTGNCLTTPFTIPAGTNEFRIIVDDRPSGRIKVIKNTVNGNGVFNYTTVQPANNLPATFGNFSLDTGVLNTASTAFIVVKPGAYSVTEGALPVPPSGHWEFTSLSCTTGGAQVGTTTTANITIIPGRDVTCTYTNTLIVPTEACSPGYWKQPQHFGSYPWNMSIPPGVNPLTTKYGTIFGNGVVDPTNTDGDGIPYEIENLTFPEAISLGGGGIYALVRHSAAAYLNSMTLAYGFSPAQVLSMTNAAMISGDYQSAQSAFAALLENENCPLGRDEGPFGGGSGIGKKN